jgi:hypothetical protein
VRWARILTASLVLACCAASGCTDGNGASDRLWTVRQAESITLIRGTPVRVRHCRGLAGRDDRYESFECLASGRTGFDRFDTVGVFYVLQPLGEYEGRRSKYRLSNVRFVGGPGIP